MLEKIVLTFFLPFAIFDTCTWDNCPTWSNDPHQKYVHLIAHTHDDMGWKQTADNLYETKVQYIINTVINELKRDPTKRFCYAEVGFLTRWLEDQPNSRVQEFIDLVQNGQMELVGGGWVQPDEGGTHYIDLIDMYTLGLGKLKEYFGTECGMPKVAWQLDPFGHSREHANLAVMMGYEALYFAREHILEHLIRIFTRKLEFNWKVSDDLENEILGGCLMFSYEAISFLCNDVECNNPPIIDNPRLEGYNLDSKMLLFYAWTELMSLFVPHNHIIMPMGGDFRYVNADMWFTNIDKYIKYANQNSAKTNITVFYSTPACYVKAMKEAMASQNIAFPNKTIDFFPYKSQDNFNNYWTGYFTSRPAFKGYVRKNSAFLQMVRQLDALASLNQTAFDSDNYALWKLERALGLSQHHDVITGTDNEMVNQNNIYRISQGVDDAEVALNVAMQNISATIKNTTTLLPYQLLCRTLNESECLFVRNKINVTVTVYNGNSWPMSSLVQVPLYANLDSATILDSEGNPINYTISAVFKNSTYIQIDNNNTADWELRFLAEVDPLGFRTYFISFVNHAGQNKIKSERQQKDTDNTISNEFITLNFDQTGRLAQYYDKVNNRNYSISQDFLFYTGADNSMGQASGPYIFRPVPGNATSVAGQNPVQINVIKGAFYQEVQQIFAPWVSQIVRLVQNKPYVEFEWTIGPVAVELDKNNKTLSKEVITRYHVDGFTSYKLFRTDSNGRQMMQREKDYNADYPYINFEPVAANYFPVNSRIIVSDNSTYSADLCVLTDRSQGGSSLDDGEIELLMHRRLFYDDHEGADGVLNEPGRDGRGLVIRGKHWLYLAPTINSSRLHRSLAYDMFHAPTVTFSTFDTVENYMKNYATKFSGIGQALPENVQLITLRRFTTTSYLVRLEHIYQKNEDSSLSTSAMVDLQTLLPTFTIYTVHELNLAANIQKGIVNTTILLNPQEIRTFEIFIQPNTTNPPTSTTPPTTTISPTTIPSTTTTLPTTTPPATTTPFTTTTPPTTTTLSTTTTATTTTSSSTATQTPTKANDLTTSETKNDPTTTSTITTTISQSTTPKNSIERITSNPFFILGLFMLLGN